MYFSRSIGLIYILLSALVIYWFGTLVSFLALLAWQTTFFSLPSALVIETRWTWNILTCTRWVGMKSDAHWAFCAFYIAFQPNDTLHCNFCACPEALEWKLQKRIPIDQIGTAWFLVSSETKLSRIFPDRESLIKTSKSHTDLSGPNDHFSSTNKSHKKPLLFLLGRQWFCKLIFIWKMI